MKQYQVDFTVRGHTLTRYTRAVSASDAINNVQRALPDEILTIGQVLEVDEVPAHAAPLHLFYAPNTDYEPTQPVA